MLCGYTKPKPKNFPALISAKCISRLSVSNTSIKKKSKRRTYIRSAYFDKEKVFLDLFWHHLFEKSNWRDRVRRMRYFGCAVELIQNSRFTPNIAKNPNVPKEMLYRFYGTTPDNELSCVQIKEQMKKKQKFLISVFPVDCPIFY